MKTKEAPGLSPATQQAIDQWHAQWLDSRGVMAMLKIGKKKLWKITKKLPPSERLPRYKFGGRFRYRIDQVQFWMESHPA